MKKEFVQLRDIKLHVVTSGPEKGPLLIFLHGFPEYWFAWRKQIEVFAKLGYRVLVPDQRGYHLSDKPKSSRSYKIDLLADDVRQLISWAGKKSAYIVGHDWGAVVAWWTALKFPHQVDKLIVLNGPHPHASFLKDPSQLKKSWYILLFQFPKLPEWYLSRNQFGMLVRALKGTSKKGTFSPEDLSHYKEAWHQPTALTSMIHWYRAIRLPRTRVQSQVQVPTLIIWGEKDRFLGKELASQSLSFCSEGRLELIADATHWVQHEEAMKVNDLILNFIQ